MSLNEEEGKEEEEEEEEEEEKMDDNMKSRLYTSLMYMFSIYHIILYYTKLCQLTTSINIGKLN